MRRKLPETASLSLERGLWAQGYRQIAGIDEAGRGAWAGPVAAGAVVLPPERADDLRLVLEGVRDSKQLSPRARAGLVERIQTTALAWGIGAADNTEIDALHIVPATCLAMGRALDDLNARFPDAKVDFLLLDSIRWQALEVGTMPHRAVIGGDRLSLSIAAASILAKVWRDERMVEYDQTYPDFGFAVHKGYGVAAHRTALDEQGACKIHRMSFRPMVQPRLLSDSSE
ncbi:MAG: ribonuclease HII [Chloroflexota bacterium]|nr:ribonuclease HII [Chloroflexota bacterium]